MDETTANCYVSQIHWNDKSLFHHARLCVCARIACVCMSGKVTFRPFTFEYMRNCEAFEMYRELAGRLRMGFGWVCSKTCVPNKLLVRTLDLFLFIFFSSSFRQTKACKNTGSKSFYLKNALRIVIRETCEIMRFLLVYFFAQIYAIHLIFAVFVYLGIRSTSILSFIHIFCSDFISFISC